MFRIFIHLADSTASTIYRSILPAIHCNNYFLKHDIPISIEIHGNPLPSNEYDAYIYHRIPLKVDWIPKILSLIESGKKIVWELDDDLYSVPEWSPASVAYTPGMGDWLSMFIAGSHAVIVSTDHLKDRLREITGTIKPINVLPNLINYIEYDKVMAKHPNQILRCLWTGSHSHVRDVDALVDVAREYKEDKNIQFIFYGYMPQPLAELPQLNVINVPFTRLPNYLPLLSYINPDISFAPLVPHVFNRSKSGIKHLETVMAGAYCLASDMEPYQEIISECGGGRLIDELDPSKWVANIEQVRAMPYAELEHINKLAKQKIRDLYSWEADNPNKMRWVNFFMELAGIEPVRPEGLEPPIQRL